MTLLKVAVLEDNFDFLKEMVDNLSRTGLVEVIVKEQHSEKFISEVKEKKPEILLLDILLDDSINGIQVAQILKLPVIFLSGAKKDFSESIESLKTNESFPPVEEYGKIPDVERLKILLKKFIPRVREFQQTIQFPNSDKYKSEYLFVKTANAKSERIAFDQIAFIRTCDKEKRDKEIHTVNSTVIIAKNITLPELLEHLPSNQFIQVNTSEIVNLNHVTKLIETDSIGVEILKSTIEISLGNKFREPFFALLPEFKK